jgi:hypothetical protein
MLLRVGLHLLQQFLQTLILRQPQLSHTHSSSTRLLHELGELQCVCPRTQGLYDQSLLLVRQPHAQVHEAIEEGCLIDVVGDVVHLVLAEEGLRLVVTLLYSPQDVIQ